MTVMSLFMFLILTRRNMDAIIEKRNRKGYAIDIGIPQINCARKRVLTTQAVDHNPTAGVP